MAARVQQALLPPADVEAGKLRVAHAFHPCDDLAGDGVGIVPLPQDSWASTSWTSAARRRGRAPVVHAESPAVAGGRGSAHHRAHRLRLFGVPPARVAERLNRQFPMDRTRQYFTLVYGVIDPASGQFDYVMAGHPAPVLLRRARRRPS